MSFKILKSFLLLSIIILSTSLIRTYYNPDYVETSSGDYKGEKIYSVLLSRKDNHVKAKYFAAKDENGKNVYSRYEKWKIDHENVILFAGGAYFDGYSSSEKPVGLTIDNGVLVNETLENSKMDGLVIIYPTGGMLATNLKDGDLAVGSKPYKKYNLRENTWDKLEFIDWAKQNNATVFQTHLLVYKNVLTVAPNANSTQRERRFLAVGKDEDGNYKHIIVYYKNPTMTLYQGAKNALDYLNNFEDIAVAFLVNLDTGVGNIFQFFNKEGSLNKNIQGQTPADQAKNLLVYYYE
jgi:hypothetical protein